MYLLFDDSDIRDLVGQSLANATALLHAEVALRSGARLIMLLHAHEIHRLLQSEGSDQSPVIPITSWENTRGNYTPWESWPASARD